MTQFERMQEYAKEKTVLELKQLKKEIKKVVKKETQHGTKWSSGLRYSLDIINDRISELTGKKPKTRKEYNHEYYIKVIKPKRQQKRDNKSGS